MVLVGLLQQGPLVGNRCELAWVMVDMRPLVAVPEQTMEANCVDQRRVRPSDYCSVFVVIEFDIEDVVVVFVGCEECSLVGGGDSRRVRVVPTAPRCGDAALLVLLAL
jgi:hypothetical protein